jgi:hypothetical protein
LYSLASQVPLLFLEFMYWGRPNLSHHETAGGLESISNLLGIHCAFDAHAGTLPSKRSTLATLIRYLIIIRSAISTETGAPAAAQFRDVRSLTSKKAAAATCESPSSPIAARYSFDVMAVAPAAGALIVVAP